MRSRIDRHASMLDEIRRELEVDDSADLERRARAFLASLDPGSTLGMWFDAFADAFPTRLEAARCYVAELPPR